MTELKGYRENEIKWYILAYLLLVIAVCYPSSVQGLDLDIVAKIEKLLVSSALSGSICTLAFVFDSVFTTKMKDALVYLGFTKIPGSKVFSRISTGKLNDIRIRNLDAKTFYAPVIVDLPDGRKDRSQYENTKWYGIYSKHKDDPRVQSGHRDSLLCRDLYIVTVILAVLTLTAAMVHLLPFKGIIFGYLFIMLIITNLAARNKARRFVDTAIAVDMTSVQKEKDKD